mmetsp:Transcript_22941/g.64055  ORF Transcript_22941/g.64055 Transcript_22941/m.64055 type:complete len:107 (-) Transcript_22941:112-432(-)
MLPENECAYKLSLSTSTQLEEAATESMCDAGSEVGVVTEASDPNLDDDIDMTSFSTVIATGQPLVCPVSGIKGNSLLTDAFGLASSWITSCGSYAPFAALLERHPI